MDLEGIVNWNKSDKDKYCMISFTCGILKNRFFFKEKQTIEYTKREANSQIQRSNYGSSGMGEN